MPIDVAEAVKQIDEMLNRFDQIDKQYTRPYQTQWGEVKYEFVAPSVLAQEVISLLRSALERLSPKGDKSIEIALGEIYNKVGFEWATLHRLAGALRALKEDYQKGRLRTFREMVQADVFSDFLEMAEYFLSDGGYKDAAAVIAGGVLEQHLRKLCDKNGISTTFSDSKGNPVPKKLDTINADLAKAGAYGGNDQKQVTAWAGIRNHAAHGDYGKYFHEQVVLMVAGIRDFLARNPA